MLHTIYFTTYTKVRKTVNEMLRIFLLRIPIFYYAYKLNKQLMKWFVLYFTTYTKR